MAKTAKINVATEVGTFTRETARTYTHIVVAGGRRRKAHVVERHYLYELKQARENLAYVEAQLAGTRELNRWETREDVEGHCERLKAQVAQLEAPGALEALKAGAALAGFWVLGWCGRLDLALKLASSSEAQHYQDVRVYAVADGARVR